MRVLLLAAEIGILVVSTSLLLACKKFLGFHEHTR